MKTSVIKHARKRVPWLMFLMLSARFTALVIGNFEESLLIAMPVLYLFIPMLMDTAGNAGSQTSAMIIRGLALGDIKSKHTLVIFWRELRIALLCGVMLGAVNLIRVYTMNGRDFLLSFTVTISLIATIVIAKTVACFLPMIAIKVKMDPAVMAAPLITTIADCVSLIVYFWIATTLLNI
jgi:magnesium transporter